MFEATSIILSSKFVQEGISPLAIAIYEGRTAVALLLLHSGGDVNLEDKVMKGNSNNNENYYVIVQYNVIILILCNSESKIFFMHTISHAEWVESFD